MTDERLRLELLAKARIQVDHDGIVSGEPVLWEVSVDNGQSLLVFQESEVSLVHVTIENAPIAF